MIGSFGDITFEVSEEQILSLNNQINRSDKSKISEHNPIYGPGMLRHQGRELIEVSFSMTLISSLIKRTSLKEELDAIKQMLELGEYANLVFGGQVFGEFPFLITEISEESNYFNKEEGGFDIVKLNIGLKEYIENPELYNQSIEQKKIQKNEQITEEVEEAVELEQKTKLQEFAEKVGNKVNDTFKKNR